MPALNELLQQGRYRIIQPLGQNGTGAVYEAFDQFLKTSVAVKEIPVDLKMATGAAQHEALCRAFSAEAKILTEIRHESLLQIHDYFAEANRHYLVTELVDGNNLSELLEKTKAPFALSDVMNWAEQMLDALHYLHTQTPPIIHREVKPRNVKLTSGGKIKLVLSLAQNADANAPIANQTLHYLPLEQILDGLDSASQKVITNSYDEKSGRILEQPPDAKSDIYALGATLYYLLTARPPVDPLERSIDILEGKSDPLAKPHLLNPQVAPEISDVLMKALEIKRENRFDSAIIMRQAWRTAFVRVKERAAQGTKKQEEDLLEIPMAEYRESEPERPSAKPESLGSKAENSRQLELMTQRLREAEARRLEAEQRAAEAEKLLREKNIKDTDDNKSPATVVESPATTIVESPVTEIKSPVVSAPISTTASAAPAASRLSAAQKESSGEFKDLFAAPPKNNKAFLRMSAVAGILVILCGAAWGVWVFVKSNQAESNQITPSQTMSLTETSKPAPTVEAAPAPSAETTPETGAIETPASPTEATEAQVSLPAGKNKTAQQPAPRVKKQTLPATKTPPAEKKPVTVDDLINDN